MQKCNIFIQFLMNINYPEHNEYKYETIIYNYAAIVLLQKEKNTESSLSIIDLQERTF